jgi:hypothetical protein
MERDRSLDEFLGGGSDDGDESDDAEDDGGVDRTSDGGETGLADDGAEVDGASEREPDDAAAETTPDDAGDEDDATALDPDAVDPATVTYQSTPAGASCDRCGAHVERRWRDGDAYVCVDCKEW